MIIYPFINGILLAVIAQDVVVNAVMGVAIVVALLVLRATIDVVGRKAMTKGVVCVLVNASSQEEAIKIGQTVVRERLAASANVVGQVRSFYHWKGKVEDQSEAIVVFKTVQFHLPALMQRVADLHSYEVPSIIALPLYMAYQPYVNWVVETTGSKSWRKWL